MPFQDWYEPWCTLNFGCLHYQVIHTSWITVQINLDRVHSNHRNWGRCFFFWQHLIVLISALLQTHGNKRFVMVVIVHRSIQIRHAYSGIYCRLSSILVRMPKTFGPVDSCLAPSQWVTELNVMWNFFFQFWLWLFHCFLSGGLNDCVTFQNFISNFKYAYICL